MDKKTYYQRIESKLLQAFSPSILEIMDNSATHAGHAGHNPLGETHFDVLIVSHFFEKQPSLARHREVYKVLAEEMKERVHALSLKCLAPNEYNSR